MQAKEISSEKPDGVLLVIAYFVILGIGFVMGGVTLLVTAVPRSLEMVRGDSFFFGGFATLVMMTIACLVFGSWILLVTRSLWRVKPGGRATAVVLAALITVMSLLSIPSFFFAFGNDRTELFAALGMALTVGAGSTAALWYLMRPQVKRFFE